MTCLFSFVLFPSLRTYSSKGLTLTICICRTKCFELWSLRHKISLKYIFSTEINFCPFLVKEIYFSQSIPFKTGANTIVQNRLAISIFQFFYSSGHLLVLNRAIFTCASCLKSACIHLDTTRWVCVNGSQKECTTCDWWNLWALRLCLFNAVNRYLSMARAFLLICWRWIN